MVIGMESFVTRFIYILLKENSILYDDEIKKLIIIFLNISLYYISKITLDVESATKFYVK